MDIHIRETPTIWGKTVLAVVTRVFTRNGVYLHFFHNVLNYTCNPLLVQLPAVLFSTQVSV